MANVVLSQMMPSGAIKGGSAMKIRMGNATTRFSKDLDFSRRDNLKSFIDELEANLVTGWHGFSGVLVKESVARPKGIPTEYVMVPFRVKLRYQGSTWMSVPLEVGHDELGDTLDPELVIAQEVVELFTSIGLPAPAPVFLLAIKYQIAQKLHAVSFHNSPRAHDLVDLQLLVSYRTLDLAEIKVACVGLFRFRQNHGWPPTVVKNEDWETLYQEAAHGMVVLPDVASAIEWANELIVEIANS